jgi:hypothetical protein
MDSNGTPSDVGCYNALRRFIYSQGDSNLKCFRGKEPKASCVSSIDTETIPLSKNVKFAKDMINQLISNYTNDGYVIGALPGTPQYNAFQDFLYEYICCPFPTVCEDALKKACSSYTSNRLEFKPEAANWCGCFLQEGEYKRYVDSYQINKECTPLCNRQAAISLSNGEGDPIKCKQGVCLIDDLTINLIKSQTGDINISQVCGGCQSEHAHCTCTIENSTIDVVNSILNGIDINQFCSGVDCTRTNPNPSEEPYVLPSSCTNPDYNPYDDYDNGEDNKERLKTVAILMIILVLGAGLTFLIYYLKR